MCQAEDELDEVEAENTKLEEENNELQSKCEELEEQLESRSQAEEDVDMLCGRLGITRHEWEMERGHIRNQLLK